MAASWAYRWGAARNPTLTEDTAGAVYSDAPANADFTDRLIENLQEKLRQYPDDAHSYGLLGAAYLQKVRESGDPGYYSKAEAALKKALELDPENFETLTTAGVLALARHQFQEGLEHGQRAHALNPYNARALGVVADALIELGIYDAGFETVQKMVDTRPDMSSYARVSYARELNGDVAGALEAMRLAVEAGSALPENTAWALTQVGLLLFNHGDLEAAEREFEAAARALPDYLPAQAGLAKVKAARGDLKGAITLYERITQVLPLSEYVIALSDCYAAAGRAEAAQRQYDLVKVLAQLQQANGVDTDLEITLFEADHPNLFSPLNETVARARRVYEKRPTIYAADVLAWALYQSGQYAEAQMYAREALKLNTQDALLWFHAGMIAARLGQVDDARQKLEQALKINPHFSLLWADVARQTLSDLPAS
ncbi:MAG: tetratricopeptide repeat protein [Anaerolineales bacterium]